MRGNENVIKDDKQEDIFWYCRSFQIIFRCIRLMYSIGKICNFRKIVIVDIRNNLQLMDSYKFFF